MTHATPAPSHATPPTRSITALSAATTVVALALLTTACLLALDASGSEGSLAGVGYVVAFVAATPAAVALLLAVPAFLLRRRSVVLARALGWTGLAVAVLPAVVLCALVTGPH